MVRVVTVSKVNGVSRAAHFLIVERSGRGSTSSNSDFASFSSMSILAGTLAMMSLRRPARAPSCMLYVSRSVARVSLTRAIWALVVAPVKSLAPGRTASV